MKKMTSRWSLRLIIPVTIKKLSFWIKILFSPMAKKIVEVSPVSKGLRPAQFDAFIPTNTIDHAIIIEDDLEVSPHWYLWLREAWKAYGHRDDINGISLCRQAMVPHKSVGNINKEIVNNHQPFLFVMLGSHGFSPDPRRWRQFLDWINYINLETFDVSRPGLVTSEWWRSTDKRHMWEQHFIYLLIDSRSSRGENLLFLWTLPPCSKIIVQSLCGVHQWFRTKRLMILVVFGCLIK